MIYWMKVTWHKFWEKYHLNQMINWLNEPNEDEDRRELSSCIKHKIKRSLQK